MAVLLTAPAAMVRHAMAAGPADAAELDDRSDRIEDQEDAAAAAADAAQARQAAGQVAPPAPGEFNFRVNAPLQYNSNAGQAPSGGPAAFEVDPEIEPEAPGES